MRFSVGVRRVALKAGHNFLHLNREWFKVLAIFKYAETMKRHIVPGDIVTVQGRLTAQVRKDEETGKKVHSFAVIAYRIEHLMKTGVRDTLVTESRDPSDVEFPEFVCAEISAEDLPFG